MAKLILGKLQKYSGTIAINNILIENINPTELMKNIILVKHNSYIFKGNVRSNLLMGNTNLSDIELNHALKQVNLYDFFSNMNGLDTLLTEQGNNISGGQRQRLAIARAILADAPIYIFDEATSNIDADSERIIMDVIEKMSMSKTILVISHRLSNIRYADKIYFMKKGCITETGTHCELINKNGEYAKLYKMQYELENIGGHINE